jgi:hypothetical protein
MSQKPKSIKVVCLSAKIKLPAPSKRSFRSVLPPLRFLSGIGSYDGVFALADGGLRQIIECKGLHAMHDDSRLIDFERALAGLIVQLDCDFQFLVKTSHFPIPDYQKYINGVKQTDDAYFKWFSDYQNKWLARVTEEQFVPHKQFFIVVTKRGDFSQEIKRNRLSVKDTEQLAALGDDVSKIIDCLAKHDQAPVTLSRSQVRGLFHRSIFAPANSSESVSNKEVVETLSQSTIREPISSERENVLRIGNAFYKSFALDELPLETTIGWLRRLVTVQFPLCVSLLIKQCPQAHARRQILKFKNDSEIYDSLKDIVSGRDKAVDVSINFSISSESVSQLTENSTALKMLLTESGAHLNDCAARQVDALRCSLPLGLDALGLVHRLSGKVATTFFPLFRGIAEQSVGRPIGFSLYSREPAFVDTEGKQNIAVCGGESDTTQSILGLVAFKSSTIGSAQLIIGGSESSKFLKSLLGPALVKMTSLDELTDDVSIDTPLTIVECARNLVLDKRRASNIKRLIEVWSRDRVSYAGSSAGELCFEDIEFLLQNREGENLLSQIFEMSDAMKFRIIIGINDFNESSPALKDVLERCALKIVVPQRCDRALLKYLEIDDDVSARCREFNCCALVGKEGLSLIRATVSPMEAYIWGDSLWIPRFSRSAYLERREKMIDKQRSENPALNHTDACRRAVYYLGLDNTDSEWDVARTN